MEPAWVASHWAVLPDRTGNDDCRRFHAVFLRHRHTVFAEPSDPCAADTRKG